MLPVHNHTHFSALDGFGKPDEIADRIKQLGLPGAFITDHGTVAGFKDFADAMTAQGLYYGLGMEGYQTQFENRKQRPEDSKKRDAFHVILLAKNDEGLRNLYRLSDESNRTGFFYAPRVDWELLEKYREGIICTSACMGGLVAKGIQNDDLSDLFRYRDIFREDFYVEIHTYDHPEQHKINQSLLEICLDYSIKPIVANDAHYPSPEDYPLHELLLAMQYKHKYGEEEFHHPKSLYIMSEDDVRKNLSYLPNSFVDAAINGTDDVAAKCQVTLPKPSLHLPKFTDSKQKSNELLETLVAQGIQERYSEITDEVLDRAEYEFNAITAAGLSDYFLIVRDFVNWAKDRGILVGPGRGSVGGCLLAYALGITDIDPIKYDLYFERFWNPGRAKGLPDIDVDFEHTRRDEVKDYLAQKYGENRVIRIANHTIFQPISSIADVGRALGISYGDIEKIKLVLQSTVDAGQQPGWDRVDQLVGEKLAKWEAKYPELFENARAMTGRIQKYGVHASAYVVSDVDLPDYLPCQMRTDENMKKEKILATQLDMHGVEEAGFPKFDLLAIRNLTTLSLALKLAGETRNPNDFYRDIDYEAIPRGEGYWEQIDKGHTVGLFQIEEGTGAKSIGKEIKPKSILDLAAIVALNRPGPLRDGGAKRFIERRKGNVSTVYPHPFLEDVLAETYGEFIYQEQVISLARKIGYDASEADDIRKILGKKLTKEMKEEEPRFIERLSQHVPRAIAKQLWNKIVTFSLYSFNKSHAVGYGFFLAWTMYPKWKIPPETIMAGIITTKKERLASFISEARKIGVDVYPPDVNYSDIEISKVDQKIYLGLSDIKGVGLPAARWIVANRPFASVDDLKAKKEQAQQEWDKNWKKAHPSKRPISPNMALKKNQIEALYNVGAFDSCPDEPYVEINPSDKAALETELLGISLTDVTNEVVTRNAKKIEKLNGLDALDNGVEGDIIPVVGVIKHIRTTRVRPDARKYAGEEMGFLSVEWDGFDASVTVFCDEWKKYKYMMKPNNVCEFDLKVDKDGGLIFEKGSVFV